MSQSFRERYARIYDLIVSDWAGEIEFYRELAAGAKARGESVLEVACGTGRVGLRLAQEGAEVTGIDLSLYMLDVARKKSSGFPNVRWVQADMKAFELGEQFGLAIMTGHAFQLMLTPHDQIACLGCVQKHLVPGGTLVVHLDHQNVAWLGDLRREKAGVFGQVKEIVDPQTGLPIHTSFGWTYEPGTQTASFVMACDRVDVGGKILEHWESEPIPVHCVFRYEMEHLLARVGLQVQAVYGDFFRHELQDESSEMIWVVRNQESSQESRGV